MKVFFFPDCALMKETFNRATYFFSKSSAYK
jgi:hypothetical protein